MSTGSRAEKRKKALNPTIDGAAVHDQASLGEPFDDIGIAQAVANVPADRQSDDVQYPLKCKSPVLAYIKEQADR
jgi:hypothetical protein